MKNNPFHTEVPVASTQPEPVYQIGFVRVVSKYCLPVNNPVVGLFAVVPERFLTESGTQSAVEEVPKELYLTSDTNADWPKNVGAAPIEVVTAFPEVTYSLQTVAQVAEPVPPEDCLINLRGVPFVAVCL
jgi:hypothetical protein